MTTNTSWNRVAKSLHWLIALCIFVAATLGWIAHESAISPGKLQLFLWHKSVGITVLGLMFLRLVWRLTHAAPQDVSGMSAQELKLANIGHWVLYAFAILLPLSGWILNSAANYPFRWFGLFEVPMLMGADKDIQTAATRAHWLLFCILAALVAGHVAMAFKHHLAGIPLLSRMLPERLGLVPTLVFLLGLSGAWVALAYTMSYSTPAGDAGNQTQAVEQDVTDESISATTAGVKSAPLWVMDAENSSLKFIATYDQIEFEGGFSEFAPVIHFDPADLGGSNFDVSINTTTVDTDNYDRDELLPLKDWFWFEEFQEAKYIASSFESLTGGQYRANGVLDLKGVSKAVPLDFSWEVVDESTAKLVGTAVMNRRDFAIGAGGWFDDPTVGYEIKVLVDITLTK